MTDSWVTTEANAQASSSLLSPGTPTRRASRTSGITNEVEHTAFQRTPASSSSAITFRVGDVVVVDTPPKGQKLRKWLRPPPFLVMSSGWKSSKTKKAQQSKANDGPKRVEGYEGWMHEDGLGAKEKVAVLVGLYENAENKMKARLRWMVRPGAVWDVDGPDEDYQPEPEPFELYYTNDSTYVHEIEARKSRKSSPSTSLSLPALPPPFCTDSNVDIAHILRHVRVVASSKEREAHRGEDVFIVKKVYDLKPIAQTDDDEGFWGDIKWDEILAKGRTLGMWDTDPVVQMPAAKKVKIVRKANPDGKGKGKATVPRVFRDDEEERSDASGSDLESSGRESDDDGGTSLSTPKKRARTVGSSAVTPRRFRPKVSALAKEKRKSQSKRQQKRRDQGPKISIGLPPPFTRSEEFKKLSTFDKAKALLHVSATPENLPGREEQRSRISDLLGHAILGRSGTCLYIHGVPGTGKTATVHSVVRELQEDDEMDPFKFVEINGMKISEPNQAFTLLWEALSGIKAAPRAALASLEEHFQTPDPTRKTTVVLVDELDQMITKKQDVIYNLFNWPHVAHSRFIVVAIANTMDLPERELSGKIQSRLGSNRIPFPTYSKQELINILKARLDGLEVLEDPAIALIAQSVSGVSGDARRALDVARRTVEKKIQSNQLAGVENLCTIQDAQATYKEMTKYGSNVFVRHASLHQKIFLLALSNCIKRKGVPEVQAELVFTWFFDFLTKTSIGPVPSHKDLFTIVAELHSLRLIVTESQRGDYFQHIRSLIEDADLFDILGEESELKNYLGRVG